MKSSYRDLKIFQLSKRLAIEVHKLSLALPKYEWYEEGSQVRRSLKAVTSLIVEGHGRRRYKPDFIKYLVYSLAECDETIIHLEFLQETGSATEDETKTLLSDYHMLGKKISAFLGWVEEHYDPNPHT